MPINTGDKQNSLRHLAAGSLQAVLAPPSHPATGMRYPLLCFLHGFNEAAPEDLESAMTMHGPLYPGAPPWVSDRFIVLAPQLPKRGDHWHRHADEVRTLVLDLQATQGADPARCYLTGFSYGGNGVFDLALQQPGFWAALWAVDPTRPPAPELRGPVWLSIGDCVRKMGKAFVDSLRSHPPTPLLQGKRIHLDEQQDHVGCARKAYADPNIYHWLLNHSLEQSEP
jgi:poly(3-hydroxybutyrate) depolymerase